MKLTLLICFFGLLAFVSSVALGPKLTRRSHRLQWLKQFKTQHVEAQSKNLYLTTQTWGSTYNYPHGGNTRTTSYPWYGSTRWNDGGTSSDVWYMTTPWYNGRTTTNPWNNPTTWYPWQGSTSWNNNPTTYYPWYTTTPSYWLTTTASPYNMCPYGAISSMSKQQCFQLFFGNLTFIEAEMDCQSRNGHLASIHNAFDNMLLNANDLTNKQWAWTDNSRFDYADWYTYQSGNAYADCALVDTSNGAWIRSDCYTRSYYACSVLAYPY
uniref:C-type lectin domain-containing protein n=1 Tax=Panagrolaimus davidi TaxID=227884 RepID=A0A914Q612_9BILA